jgi:hypothetical protein
VISLVLAAVVEDAGRIEVLGWIGINGISQLLSTAPMAVGAVLAVFWAAPLVSREYEHKTSVVVWSQDLTPARWVLGKIVLLGVPAIALAAVFGASVRSLMRAVNGTYVEDYRPFRPFEAEVFESAPLVQIAYVAFGFALGLALSALTRRTVVAMGLALGGYFVARMVVALAWRPYYQDPVRQVWDFSTTGGGRPQMPVLDTAMHVHSGYLDRTGAEVDFPMACARISGGRDEFEQCMNDQGIVQNFLDYQPADRVGAFQVFEFFVFAVPAAALLVFAYYWVKRSHRI